eukprot:847244-Pyramimonas_sp.AAC.1
MAQDSLRGSQASLREILGRFPKRAPERKCSRRLKRTPIRLQTGPERPPGDPQRPPRVALRGAARNLKWTQDSLPDPPNVPAYPQDDASNMRPRCSKTVQRWLEVQNFVINAPRTFHPNSGIQDSPTDDK